MQIIHRVLLLIIVASLGMLSAQGQDFNAEICNEGTSELSAATVESQHQLLFGAPTGEYVLSGWYRIHGGSCETFRLSSNQTLYMALVARDRDGWRRLVEASPSSRGHVQRSDKEFCVKNPGPFGPRIGRLDDLERCPKEWFRIPFRIKFERADRGRSNLTQALSVPDRLLRDWKLGAQIPNQEREPLSREAPMPGETGTLTAHLLNGTQVVRWNDRWRDKWFFDSGKEALEILELEGETSSYLFRPPRQRSPADPAVVSAVQALNRLLSSPYQSVFSFLGVTRTKYISSSPLSVDEYGVLRFQYELSRESSRNASEMRYQVTEYLALAPYKHSVVEAKAWQDTPQVEVEPRGELDYQNRKPVSLTVRKEGSKNIWSTDKTFSIPVPDLETGRKLSIALEQLASLYPKRGIVAKEE